MPKIDLIIKILLSQVLGFSWAKLAELLPPYIPFTPSSQLCTHPTPDFLKYPGYPFPLHGGVQEKNHLILVSPTDNVNAQLLFLYGFNFFAYFSQGVDIKDIYKSVEYEK